MAIVTVDDTQITQLGALLKAIDAGDRIVKGRLELFEVSRRRLSRRQHDDLQRRAPDTFADSPLGPLATDSAQNLLMNLTSLMQMLFVDHDCTRLTPHDFERCPDLNAVVQHVNHDFAAIVDRVRGDRFLERLWHAVHDVVDVRNCEVYLLRPAPGTFEPIDTALLSFFYFFVNQNLGRILFMGGVTTSRNGVRLTDSGSEVTVSEDNMSNSSKEQSSVKSSLHDGEYAFDSDGDCMDDS